MTVVGVVSDIESNTLTFPPFSPTNTRPSEAKRTTVGRSRPEKAVCSSNTGSATARCSIDGASEARRMGWCWWCPPAAAGRRVGWSHRRWGRRVAGWWAKTAMAVPGSTPQVIASATRQTRTRRTDIPPAPFQLRRLGPHPFIGMGADRVEAHLNSRPGQSLPLSAGSAPERRFEPWVAEACGGLPFVGSLPRYQINTQGLTRLGVQPTRRDLARRRHPGRGAGRIWRRPVRPQLRPLRGFGGERRRVGGTCLLRGCIPAKTWLQSAEVMTTVKRRPTSG